MTRPFRLHTGIAEVTSAPGSRRRWRASRSAAPAFADFGVEQPGKIITLGWCDEGEELVLPLLRWRFRGGKREQHWRDYTVRETTGPSAPRWTSTSSCTATSVAPPVGERGQPGDRVGFAGPRLHWRGATGCQVCCSSPTRPACRRCSRSSDAPRRPPRDRDRRRATTIRKRSRRGPTSTSLDLARAAARPARRACSPTRVRRLRLPPERGQAWGGGEALAMRDVRRHLVANRPAIASSRSLMGYWKHRATPEDVE